MTPPFFEWCRKTCTAWLIVGKFSLGFTFCPKHWLFRPRFTFQARGTRLYIDIGPLFVMVTR